LDLIATSTDPPALIAAFCAGEWVAEVVARGDTKATVVSHGAPLRPARGRGGLLRQRPTALHGLEGPQHRAPRRGAATGIVDLRVRSDRRRLGRGGRARHGGRALRIPGLRIDPARVARGYGRDRRRTGALASRSGRAG